MGLLGNTLTLDPRNDGDNLDSILNSINVKNIKHMKMFFPQELTLGASSSMDYMEGIEARTPSFKLSPGALEKFLRGQEELISFEMEAEDCCFAQVSKMINNGKALRPLARIQTLEKLVFANVAFAKVEELTVILKSLENLKELVLNYVVIGNASDHGPWPRAACDALALEVSNLKKLVKLEIQDHYFVDEDVVLLFSSPGMPELRCLNLEGTFGELTVRGSCLTDEAFATIARECPNLQALNLDFHEKATEKGVRAILQGCLHLRELSVTRVRIPPAKLGDVMSVASKKLLLFRLGEGYSRDTIINAMKATGGRVLFTTEFAGLVAPVGLPPKHVEAHKRSKKLCEEATNKLEDPTTYNEWEALF